jgi:hypothetical protein
VTRAVPIRSATDLLDATFVGKWTDRESVSAAARAALGRVLAGFVDTGGPLAGVALGDEAILAELDAQDLILLRDGHVLLAYPFSGVPTPFVTVLADGRERHACCAIDALGIAALLGERVHVRSRCHDCGEDLALDVGPDGPERAADLMVWVGARDDLRARACTAL